MRRKKTIYIFGNLLLDFDNLPLKLAPKLKKIFPEINFVTADPNENLEPKDKELIIIDSVEEIDEVVLIDDIEKLQTQKLYSLHDFDLAFNLKLLKKIGKLKKIKIIGVPMKGEKKEILEKIKRLLRTSLRQPYSTPNSLSRSARRRTYRGRRRE